MEQTYYPLPPVKDWKDFFTELEAHGKNTPPEPVVQLDHHAWEKFFSDLNALYLPYKKQGRSVNFVELAGVGRNELRNSTLLAWLFDCHGSHGQGAIFHEKVRSRCSARFLETS